MANTRAPIQNIPLNGNLNLNKLRSDIKPYTGFIENNSPVFGGALSPLFVKKEDKQLGVEYAVDNESNIYSLSRNQDNTFSLKKNQDTIYTYSADTKFLHRKSLKLSTNIRCVKSLSDGFFVYLNNNTVERYRLVNGLLVRVYSASLLAISDSSLLACGFSEALNQGVIYLAVYRDYSIFTLFTFNTDTGVLERTDNLETSLAFNEGTLSYPMLNVINIGQGYLVLSLYTKTGHGITSPDNVLFIYNTANSSFVSSDPATVTTVGGTVPEDTTAYYPTACGPDGRFYPKDAGIGKTVGTVQVTGSVGITGTIKYVSSVRGPESGTYIQEIAFQISTNWDVLSRVNVSYTYYDYEGTPHTETFEATRNTTSATLRNLSYGGIRASMKVTGVTYATNYDYTDQTSYPLELCSFDDYPDNSPPYVLVSGTKSCNYLVVRTTSKIRIYYYGRVAPALIALLSQNTIPVQVGTRYVDAEACEDSWQSVPAVSGSPNVSQPLPCNYTIAPMTYQLLVPVKGTQYIVQGVYRPAYLPHSIFIDCVQEKVKADAGYIEASGTFYSPYGSRVEKTGFTYLINYGQVYGVSYVDESMALGVLCSDWNSFSDSPSLCPSIYSSSSSDEKDTCTYASRVESSTVTFLYADNLPEMSFVLNQYLVIHTTRHNYYDTKTGNLNTGFLDYNDRVIPANDYLGATSFGGVTPYSELVTRLQETGGKYLQYQIYASALNPLYSVSKKSMIGLQLPENIIFGARISLSTASAQVSNYTDLSIDFFYTPPVSSKPTDSATLETHAPYVTSLYKNNLAPRAMFVGQYYPSNSDGNVLYSLSLFTRYINSYINRDMVVEDGTGYPLQYDEQDHPVFGTYSLSGIEGITGMFVIQSMMYATTDVAIRGLSYYNGALTSQAVICTIQGMKYIGSNTKVAYFYSEYNKSIYAFTGDNVLTKIYECTDVDTVYTFAYNPTTGSVLVATNIGVLVVSVDMGVYCIEIPGVLKIDSAASDVILSSAQAVYLVRFSPSTGYNKIPVRLQTEYYGLGSNQVSKTDTIYLRLYTLVAEDSIVKVSSRVLTDSGYQTETKEFKIKSTDWDKDTKSYYLRYQPKYQTSVGFSLLVESESPIYSIAFGATPLGVTQLTKASV